MIERQNFIDRSKKNKGYKPKAKEHKNIMNPVQPSNTQAKNAWGKGTKERLEILYPRKIPTWYSGVWTTASQGANRVVREEGWGDRLRDPCSTVLLKMEFRSKLGDLKTIVVSFK